MQLNDRGFLWDISQACDDILVFVKQLTYEQFEYSKLVRFAVERQLMVIGEAVVTRRVPELKRKVDELLEALESTSSS